MTVEMIMTRDPICALAWMSAHQAAHLMKEADVGSLPVISDHHSRELIGIVTDRDLCRTVVAAGIHPQLVTVRESMHAKPIACTPEESVESCAHLMQIHQIRRIPVVNTAGACIGIVTQADLARHVDAELLKETIAEISAPKVGAVAA